MFIYYKQKEIDDLSRVDSINATLEKIHNGMTELIGRDINRISYYLILAGAMTFKEILLRDYAQTRVPERKISENPNNGIYARVCPPDVHEFGDTITEELGKIKFPPDVIVFSGSPTSPTISQELIKKYYPRLYTVEVEKLSPEVVADMKKNTEELKYSFHDIKNIKVRMNRVLVYKSIPRMGYRQLENGEMTFSEDDYYRDVAKAKLNL